MEENKTPISTVNPHAFAGNKRGSILRSLSFGELKGPLMELNISLEVPTITSEKTTENRQEGQCKSQMNTLRKRKTMAIPKRFIDIVPPDVLETLSAKEVRRQEIIFEIMNTERHYVNDLKLLIENFLTPLRERELISKSEIASIFSNVEIIQAINGHMLSDFEERKLNDGPVIQLLGDIFLNNIKKFKPYSIYCSNQRGSIATLQELEKTNSEFKKFLQTNPNKYLCRGLGICDFLILPLQRLCKYPLFINSLIESTGEDHGDYKPLMKAHAAIKKLVALVNEKTKEVDNMERLTQLQKKYFTGSKIDLLSEKRTFVREVSVGVQEGGSVTERKQSILLLFNDSLLLFHQKKLNLTIYLQSSLLDLHLGDLHDNTLDLHSLSAGKVVQPPVVSITFKDKSEAERWVSILSRYSSRLLKEKREKERERERNERNERERERERIERIERENSKEKEKEEKGKEGKKEEKLKGSTGSSRFSIFQLDKLAKQKSSIITTIRKPFTEKPFSFSDPFVERFYSSPTSSSEKIEPLPSPASNSSSERERSSTSVQPLKNTPIHHNSTEALLLSKSLRPPSGDNITGFNLIKDRISSIKAQLEGKDDAEKVKELYTLLVHEITHSSELQMKLDTLGPIGKLKESASQGSKRNQQAITLSRFSSLSNGIYDSSPTLLSPTSVESEKSKGKKEKPLEKKPSFKNIDLIDKNDNHQPISKISSGKSTRFHNSVSKIASAGSLPNISKDPSSAPPSIEFDSSDEDNHTFRPSDPPLSEDGDHFATKLAKKKGQSLSSRRRKDKIVSVMNFDFQPDYLSPYSPSSSPCPSPSQSNSEHQSLIAQVQLLTHENEALKAKMLSLQSLAKSFESSISSLLQ